MGDAQQNNEDNNGKQAVNYIKYTGIVFQMLAIIGLFAAAGYWLDNREKHETPWVTAISSLVGVAISLYTTIRQLTRNE